MDIDVILGIVCGYGAEQLLIAVAVSVVAALIKRKAKLDLRRELVARLVFSLALKNLLKDGTPEEEFVFITDVVIALKKFV